MGFVLFNLVCLFVLFILVCLVVVLFVVGMFLVGFGLSVSVVDLWKVEVVFVIGDYDICLFECIEVVEVGIWNEWWYCFKIDVELMFGKYEDVKIMFDFGLVKYLISIYLCWWGFKIFYMNGIFVEVESLLVLIDMFFEWDIWCYFDVFNWVIVGCYVEEIGSDFREILENYYNKVK